MPQPISRYAGTQTASTQTTTTITTRVRALLNEATAGFWDDTHILQWINDAQRDIVSKTWCIGANETITLLNSTLEYAIVNDYTTLISCQYLESAAPVKSLLKGHPSMVGHVPDPGEPVYWYEWDGKIGVFPLVADATGMTVSLYQVPVLADLAAGNTLTIPFIFDDAVVFYATAMALYRDNELSTAQETLRIYETAISRFTQEMEEKPADTRNNPKGK
jgi:hypothetical protein